MGIGNDFKNVPPLEVLGFQANAKIVVILLKEVAHGIGNHLIHIDCNSLHYF